MSLSPALFDLGPQRTHNLRYVGSARARPALRAYFAPLVALGLSPMVSVVYPVDEPETTMADAGEIPAVLADTRAVLAELGINAEVGVIYGPDLNFVGREWFDLVGCDKTPGPCDVPLVAGQRLNLIAYGANPWREVPAPYVTRAQSDPTVFALFCFAWFDNVQEFGAGIGSNGMQATYRAAGLQLKGA